MISPLHAAIRMSRTHLVIGLCPVQEREQPRTTCKRTREESAALNPKP